MTTVGPVTINSADMARQIAVPLHKLHLWAWKSRDRSGQYTEFSIPRRHGEPRRIQAPVRALGFVQKRIVEFLSQHVRPMSESHGFTNERSILTNALCHLHSKVIVNIDIADFFGSINFGRVRGALMAPPLRMPADCATLVAQLCTFRDALPQGAPSSPFLANLVVRRLDSQLSKLARDTRTTYSRYADDITFSSHSRPRVARVVSVDENGIAVPSRRLLDVIAANGFRLNDRKTRVLGAGARQEVTGVVLNGGSPNVPRAFVREIRATLHAAERYGVEAAAAEHVSRWNGAADLENVLRGKIGHVGFIRGVEDRLYGTLAARFNVLFPDATPIERRTPPSLEAELRRRCVVIEDGITQGTAWLLRHEADHSLSITCSHCVPGDGIDVVDHRTGNVLSRAVVQHRDAARDLVLLRHPAIPGQVGQAEMPISIDDQVVVGLHIHAFGFADHSTGADGFFGPGQVAGRRTRFGQQIVLCSARLSAGMSGGPVVTARGTLVGVIIQGAASLTNRDEDSTPGFIPPSSVRQFLFSAGVAVAAPRSPP